MIELSGIARRLRLNVEQIRVAADLLEQGYSAAFIERYRGDETGLLSLATLSRLKFELDRRGRIAAARDRALKFLPKDATLDQEAERAIAAAQTVAAIEAALRCFRSRRALEHSQEKDGLAGKLLESMLTYSGPPIDDLSAWAAEQLEVDASGGAAAISQVARLVSSLIQSDTSLNDRMRQIILRTATVRVGEFVAPVAGTQAAGEGNSGDQGAQSVGSPNAQEAETAELHHADDIGDDAHLEHEDYGDADHQQISDGELLASDSEHTSESQIVQSSDVTAQSHLPANTEATQSGTSEFEPTSATAEKPAVSAKQAGSSKSPAKLTPRQRRRRWLASTLAPLRTLNKALNKLTAYQQLMLSRGIRSHLVSIQLAYNLRPVVELARNSFTDSKHPLSDWLTSVITETLENGLKAKLDNDVFAENEELASENLLEHSTDDLRRQLMRRPVRGHTIALIDTVGPKTVVMAVVDPAGNVLACEEIPCSAQPETISQNVVKLGELIHKHRVTLLALSNGPARRFMVLTVRELMQQSKDSGLRWVMADRNGAEAYAGSRIGLKEHSTYNRRQRAAIWAARCIQDPLIEMLKADVSRLRLGSYQRELPQEPLRQLVQDAVADCVCARGVDTRNASERELQYIPGVRADQAKQIAALATTGQLTSRQQLQSQIEDWPEVDQRQALGWLRVFGSDCTLDATLIHPEDYRLAERLIGNTELKQPPAAPEGWTQRSATSANMPSSESSAAASAGNALETVRANESESVSNSPADEINQSSPSSDNSLEILPTTDATASVDAASESVGADDANGARETDVSATNATMDDPVGGGQALARRPIGLAPEYPEQIQPTSPNSLVLDAEKLANQWQVGRAKLKWIASALQDPLGDPRLDGTPAPMLTDMPTLSTLQPGMCVWAVVIGVAEFGAFVELAPNCNGMIHISRLSPLYVEDPHQCVQVGDLLLTWVVSIDEKKNRVALTCLSPQQQAQMQAEAQQRKTREEQERSHGGRGQRGHEQRGQGQQGQAAGDRSQRRDGARGQGSGRSDSSGSATGGGSPHGQARSGAAAEQGQTDRAPRRDDRGRGGSGNRGAGSRGDDGRSRAADSGRGRSRDSGSRHSKSVVIASKKPKEPISQAMKEGDEPLRSFSDLMQFYESKRTGDANDSNKAISKQTTVQQAPEQAARPENLNSEQPALSVTSQQDSAMDNCSDVAQSSASDVSQSGESEA